MTLTILRQRSMKLICLALFFVAFLSGASAQNWRPVNPDYNYNYHDPMKDSIFSIRVLGKAKKGNDSTYILTNRLEECNDAACIATAKRYHNNRVYVRASFGLMRLNVLMNGNSYRFADDRDTFIIMHAANVGSSWQMNAKIKASVKAKAFITFLGVQDSVKTIVTNNNDTILLSKNYGFIQFPMFDKGKHNYTLRGVEGKGIGFHFPYAKDIYNYEVGDAFEYSLYYFYFSGPLLIESFNFGTSTQTVNGVLQYRIVDKKSIQDSVLYTIRGFLLNKTNGIVTRANATARIGFADERFQGPKAYEGIYSSAFKKYGRQYTELHDSMDYAPVSSGSDTFYLRGIADLTNEIRVYQEGLGLTNDNWSSIAQGLSYNLSAFKKKDTSVGIFTKIDTTNVGISPNGSEDGVFRFKLRENPSSGNAILDYDLAGNMDININISDIQGRVLYQGNEVKLMKCVGNILVNTYNLKSGLYFLKINYGSNSHVIRLVKL